MSEGQEHHIETEEAPEKKVVATKVSGTVKWFNVKNGYGFINRDDNKEDVFVHQTAIKKNNPKKYLRSVGDGEAVEFDVVEGDKGTEAANVTGPDGAPVEGSKYAAERRNFRRRYYRRRRPQKENGEVGEGSAGEGETSEGGGDGEKKNVRRRGRGGGRYRGGGYRRYRGPPRNRSEDDDDKENREEGEDRDNQSEQRPRRGGYRGGRGGRGGGRNRRYRGPPRNDGELADGDEENRAPADGEKRGRRRRFRRRRGPPRESNEQKEGDEGGHDDTTITPVASVIEPDSKPIENGVTASE
ncbi:uncharacterized protein [Antedon mediterranea]|uniref:uncharacterized protein n=1 Tax=Antedon mediterranea TaxID=105859 RepID=UPI003AF7D73C